MENAPRFVATWPYPRRDPGDELPTPPESPRKRMRLLRDSDETDGDISIETYLYRTNPYRSTTIPNPPPYPVKVTLLPETEQQPFQPLHAQIEEILSNNGFPSIHDAAGGVDPYTSKGKIRFVHMSKPGYPGGEDPIPVFLIQFHDGGLPKNMGPARDQIRDLLYMHGLRVHVEIVVEEYYRQLTFAISPTHNAVTIYNNAEQAIVDALHTNLGRMWEGLCLFNVGFSHNKVTPTIVVYVQPSVSFDWSSLRSELLALTSGDPEIDISFRPGVKNTLMDPGSLMTGLSQAVQPIKPGTSIGVKGVLSSGTLGGYFNLEFEGKIHRGFLTNYHVLAPRNAPQEIQKKADMFGSSPAVDDETRCEVVAPSEEDTAYQITEINNLADSLEAKKTQLEEKRAMLEMGEDSSQKIDRVNVDINKNSENIDYWRSELTRLRSLPYRLGKVFLSSGRTIFEERVSDWAFAELDSALFPSANIMPLYGTRGIQDHHPRIRQPGAAAPGTPATGFGEIQEGEIYIKEGRTTGVTIGICNGTSFFDPKHERYYVQGVEQPLTGTRELVILSIDGKQDFCQPGDSGSLVYDIFGKISGLLFGQLDDHLVDNHPCFVTTFPSILKAIKEKGGVLIEPNSTPYQGASGDS